MLFVPSDEQISMNFDIISASGSREKRLSLAVERNGWISEPLSIPVNIVHLNLETLNQGM